MNILITNDDGIFAPGLKALASELIKNGHNVEIFAPDKQNSGKSHSITLRDALIVKKVNIPGLNCKSYSVSGTPADCVRAAVQINKSKYDFCFSGCNYGYNAGKDICYSGTVSAAFEANLNNIPAFAVSIDFDSENPKFETACIYTLKIFNKINQIIKDPIVININSPSVTSDKIMGIKVCNTDSSITNEYKTVKTDEEYSIKLIGRKLTEAGKDTDIYYLRQNYISLTPLMYDVDDYNIFDKLRKCL